MSGSSGSFDSALDERTRNNLYVCFVLGLYNLFSGAFGLFGAAMDDKGANKPNKPAHLIDC